MHRLCMMTFYMMLLFLSCLPGQVGTLPVGKRLYVNIAHAFVFAVIWQLTHKQVWKAIERM